MNSHGIKSNFIPPGQFCCTMQQFNLGEPWHESSQYEAILGVLMPVSSRACINELATPKSRERFHGLPEQPAAAVWEKRGGGEEGGFWQLCICNQELHPQALTIWHVATEAGLFGWGPLMLLSRAVKAQACHTQPSPCCLQDDQIQRLAWAAQGQMASSVRPTTSSQSNSQSTAGSGHTRQSTTSSSSSSSIASEQAQTRGDAGHLQALLLRPIAATR